MLKSRQYHLAQLAVMATPMSDDDKLEIVHTLMEQEDLEKYRERKEAESDASV